MIFEHEATRRILVRKGLLTNEEVLEGTVAKKVGQVPTDVPARDLTRVFGFVPGL